MTCEISEINVESEIKVISAKTRYLVTHLCVNAQWRQYMGTIGTVTMATAASQLGHLTFLTDSSVLLFPPEKQGTPLAQQRPPPISLCSSSYPFLLFLLFHSVISC